MTALPSVVQTQFQPSEHYNAYVRCYNFEAITPIDAPAGHFSERVAARLLGYLLIHAPTSDGRDALAREITSCADNVALFELAKLYMNHFIRCFKRAEGSTPNPSHHPSRPSFDNMQEMLGYLLEEAPKGHQTTKALALIRDGYRCVLTKRRDISIFTLNSPPQPPPGAQYPSDAIKSKLCHILPESTNANMSGDDEGGRRYQYAAGVWAVMNRFGDVLITEELNGLDVNRLDNVLTMDPSLHHFFDNLLIWFEETGVSNQYNIRAVRNEYLASIIQPVTFTTSDPVNLPVPSPRYLRLHAAAAQVAHLSGAGECVDRILKDLADTRVMADCSEFATILAGALSFLPRQSSVDA